MIKSCRTTEFKRTKTHELIRKVYGESAVSRATFRCYAAFTDGMENKQGEERSGRRVSTKTDENIARTDDGRYSCNGENANTKNHHLKHIA